MLNSDEPISVIGAADTVSTALSLASMLRVANHVTLGRTMSSWSNRRRGEKFTTSEGME
jgi:hypothetical protein